MKVGSTRPRHRHTPVAFSFEPITGGLMSSMRQCQHVKPSGIFCGSPALRGHSYCYYHHEQGARERRRRRYTSPDQDLGLDFGALDTPESIQINIAEVMYALIDKRIDQRTARTLLYALQLALQNLKHLRLKPLYGEDQVIAMDFTDTVDQFDAEDDDEDEELEDQPTEEAAEAAAEDEEQEEEHVQEVVQQSAAEPARTAHIGAAPPVPVVANDGHVLSVPTALPQRTN